MYSKLARQAAEHWVKTQDFLPLPEFLPPETLRQRACYVSIFENPGHRLRYLAGNILPQYPTLAQEIIVNTVNAITRNSTAHIRRVDLPHISYSVALLGPLQRISSEQHLDPMQCGLYLTSDRGKSAVVLPGRAGIETAADQVATALREAHIVMHEESVTMYRFSVEYYDA